MNGVWHKNDDENLVLSNREKKGKFKKIANGELTAQYCKKNKDITKVK
jgi:hypothetical protein